MLDERPSELKCIFFYSPRSADMGLMISFSISVVDSNRPHGLTISETTVLQPILADGYLQLMNIAEKIGASLKSLRSMHTERNQGDDPDPPVVDAHNHGH
jgi:hypothetical protein